MKNKILYEGGKAVLSLLSRLQSYHKDKPLNITKIPQIHLKTVFDKYITPILKELKEKKLIKASYNPDFSLGSTRLAAYISGYNTKLYRNETPEIISQAIQKKQQFGDLDVDIVLEDGVDITDIGEYLQNTYPDIYAYKKINNNEISLAIVLEDQSVIQVDFVNVSENPEAVKFMQVSSLKDISMGIKGYAQKMLLASVLAVKKLSTSHKKLVEEFLKNDPDALKAINSGYSPVVQLNGDLGRYSLSPNFQIYIVVDMKKSGVKTTKKFKVNEQPIYQFSNVQDLVNFIFPNEKGDFIVSFVDIIEYIKKNFSKSDIVNIKKKFIERISEQKQSLSPEDVDVIIKFLEKELS